MTPRTRRYGLTAIDDIKQRYTSYIHNHSCRKQLRIIISRSFIV